MAKHKKYSILEFATRLSNYDANSGGGYGKITNGSRGSERSSGSPYGIYDDPSLDVNEDEEEDLDDSNQIDVSSKIDYGLPHSRVDIGRSNPQNTSFDNIGYAYGSSAALTEMTIDPRDDSTSPVAKGISPNLTYRGSSGQKVTKTSMSSTTYPKLYTRPRVDMSATQYGTSRAPLPQKGEENLNPIFSLSDMLDNPEEYGHRKLKHRENTVKKIIESIYF